MYQTIKEMLFEHGYGDEVELWGLALQKMRGCGDLGCLITLMVLEKKFGINLDAKKLDDLPDEVLRQNKEIVSRLISGDKQQMKMAGGGVVDVRIPKTLDGIFAAKVPASVKNLNIIRRHERIMKRVHAFESLQEVMTYRFQVVKNSYTEEVVKTAIAALINKKIEEPLGDLFNETVRWWDGQLPWDECRYLKDEFGAAERYQQSIEEARRENKFFNTLSKK